MRQLPMFMTPPAIPARGPATDNIVAQNGPSTASTDAVDSASISAASRWFAVAAPIATDIVLNAPHVALGGLSL